MSMGAPNELNATARSLELPQLLASLPCRQQPGGAFSVLLNFSERDDYDTTH
jgi:hypothetical protein